MGTDCSTYCPPGRVHHGTVETWQLNLYYAAQHTYDLSVYLISYTYDYPHEVPA